MKQEVLGFHHRNVEPLVVLAGQMSPLTSKGSLLLCGKALHTRVFLILDLDGSHMTTATVGPHFGCVAQTNKLLSFVFN